MKICMNEPEIPIRFYLETWMRLIPHIKKIYYKNYWYVERSDQCNSLTIQKLIK